MKELLLVEKSSFKVNSSDTDKYVLEGVFTQLDIENKNGRIYTPDVFLPHLKALQKIVEQTKCVGELDHPPVFETKLRNVSHVIEKIWYEEDTKTVKGRIRLVDTDAGKQAKALVDAGIPLHISSRAAGSVKENKQVVMHKLFTYDLVADPGFEQAVLNTVNENYGFSLNENFFIFDPSKSAVNESKAPSNLSDVLKEIQLIKEAHSALITQNNEIVNEWNESEVTESIDNLASRLELLEKWANTNSNYSIDNNKVDELVKKMQAFEAWSQEVTNTVSALESWSEEATATVSALESWSEEATATVSALESWSEEATATVSALESWSEEATATVSALESWSEEATATVSALESWSEEATATVSALESWSEEATATVSALESWSEEATATVTSLEESISSGINPINKITESTEVKLTSIYNKIDAIIAEAKKQEVKPIVESNQTVSTKTNSGLEIPEKYTNLWECLSTSKKLSIVKRYEILDLSSPKAINEFWDSTFSSPSLQPINENKSALDNLVNENQTVDKRAAIVAAYKGTFGF